MSSDEAENKNIEETSKDGDSALEEKEEHKEEEKEEKVNNKAAAKKKGADPPKIKQPAKKRVKTEQAEKETKKEDVKEEKKKVEEKEEEDEEEDESDEENDVNHKVVPLLDQPLEVSGKRRSKVVQRFKPVDPEEENKEVKIPEGKGKALGEVERIDFNIQRGKPEDLKVLHRLCFGKPGKAATLKKMLKKFNGFEFSVDSAEFDKKKDYVDKGFKKVKVSQLKSVCQILDIERGGTRDEIIERILKFITNPVDSGKKLPGGGRSKRKGASNKNYDEGDESHKSRKRTKTKKNVSDSEESENEKEDDDDEDEKEDVDEKEDDKKEDSVAEGSDEEKSEEEEKPKKGAKKGKKAGDAADKKAPPKKRAAAKKAAEKKSDSEADGDDSDEEEPLSKKVKNPPSDEDIKTYVKSLLEGANLELITMKKVCQDVYAHYPDFDLAHKKDFIKTTVKNLISS